MKKLRNIAGIIILIFIFVMIILSFELSTIAKIIIVIFIGICYWAYSKRIEREKIQHNLINDEQEKPNRIEMASLVTFTWVIVVVFLLGYFVIDPLVFWNTLISWLDSI